MTTFLSILFVLLAINVLFLFFSVGPKDSSKKPFQDVAKSSDIKLFQGQYSETEYKEAV